MKPKLTPEQIEEKAQALAKHMQGIKEIMDSANDNDLDLIGERAEVINPAAFKA
jgi:hypothetical protein